MRGAPSTRARGGGRAGGADERRPPTWLPPAWHVTIRRVSCLVVVSCRAARHCDKQVPNHPVRAPWCHRSAAAAQPAHASCQLPHQIAAPHPWSSSSSHGTALRTAFTTRVCRRSILYSACACAQHFVASRLCRLVPPAWKRRQFINQRNDATPLSFQRHHRTVVFTPSPLTSTADT